MLEDHHGVVVADRGLEDSLGVIGIGDRDDLKARHSGEVAFEALRVLAAAAGRADRGAHDQRHLDLPARHVAHLGDIVDDLVERQQEEVAVLDVGDRPQAHHCRAAGDTEEAEFRDGRIDHAIGESLLQSQGHGERAAPPARHPDIFPDAEHARIALHFFGNGLAQRFGDPKAFGHRFSSFPLGEYIGGQFLHVWLRRLPRLFNRLVELTQHTGPDCF